MKRSVRRGVATVSALCALISAVQAAPVVLPHDGAPRPGQPVHQEFLSDGISVLTTAEGRRCMASATLGSGTLRPAASFNALDSAEGPPVWRVQVKYPFAPDAPVTLRAGGAELVLPPGDPAREASGDSLLLQGPGAEFAMAAVQAGSPPVVEGRHRDSGQPMADLLRLPDLAALEACRAGLADLPEPPVISNEVRIVFRGDPRDSAPATAIDLAEAGIAEPPGDLLAVEIETVTGLVLPTGRAYVAFDPDGSVARFHLAGTVAAELERFAGKARLSCAADTNLPPLAHRTAERFPGRTQPICHYILQRGRHLLADCFPAFAGGLPEGVLPQPEPLLNPVPGARGAGAPDLASRITALSGGGGSGPRGRDDDGGNSFDPEDPDDPVDPPSPVPLPAAGLLMLGALAGLAGLRRRTRRNELG